MSGERFDLDGFLREAAQSPARKMLFPLHLVRTFANAANGGAKPTIEDWALAARLTAAELSKAGAEIERLQVVFEEACNEVRMSHGVPCFCKYCHKPEVKA